MSESERHMLEMFSDYVYRENIYKSYRTGKYLICKYFIVIVIMIFHPFGSDIYQNYKINTKHQCL